MMEGDIKALTEMQSSDTVIELKYVEKAETQFSGKKYFLCVLVTMTVIYDHRNSLQLNTV